VYKFHYAPRPKYDWKIEINENTEIPAIIPKDKRKRKPDPKEYDNKVQ
jgi:hypothetical protein